MELEHFNPVQQKPYKTKKVKSLGPVNALVMTVFIYFAAQIVGAIAVGFVAYTVTGSEQGTKSWLQDSVSGQFIFIAFVETLTVGMLLSYLNHLGLTIKAIGVNRKPKWSDIGFVLVGFGMYMLASQVVMAMVQYGLPKLNESQKQSIGFDTAHGTQLILVFISLVLLPPIVEELVMRGFLYGGLRKKLPKLVAALLTSVLFATAHLELGSGTSPVWSAALDTFILSLVLIFLYEKTNSLWSSIGLHMLKNSVAFIYLFIVAH